MPLALRSTLRNSDLAEYRAVRARCTHGMAMAERSGVSHTETHTCGAPRSAFWLLAFGIVISLPLCASADIAQHVDGQGVISLTSKAGRVRTVNGGNADRARASASENHYDAYVTQASALYQIPEDLIRAVIMVESGYNPRAVSKADARGLMQLVPSTASRMLVDDVFDPRQNIFGGVRYLRVLANLFNGDLFLTLAAYNAGEGAVAKFGGIPPYPETQSYVARVVAHYRQYQAQKQ